MPQFIAPKPLLEVFTCPHCDVTARQQWYGNHNAIPLDTDAVPAVYYKTTRGIVCNNKEISTWAFCECENCKKLTVWHSEEMVFPKHPNGQEPSPDMPDDVRDVYLEADSVLELSPKSAAALLRLALQMLLKDVLQDKATDYIDRDIKQLKTMTGNDTLIKALDTVRVFGNESVHPGTIDLNETTEDAEYLFTVLNMIVEYLISQPRRLNEMFEQIPPRKRNL